MATRNWRRWVALFGAAALLRAFVALILLFAMPMVSDAKEYFDVAVRFASGDFRGAFYWPAGEPLALAGAFAIFGPSLLVARVVTIGMSVGVVALTALVARELAGPRAAWIAGWIAAAYAPSVLLCGQTYSQHLAALCIAALGYFGLRALRERRPILFASTGLALGFGCLTRPSMVSLVPVLVVAWMIAVHRSKERRSLVGGALLAVCTAFALVGPVLAHNAREGAGWTISTNNERNLFLGNNPYTPDYKTSHLGQRSLDELAPDARAYLEKVYDQPNARAAMRNAALSYMASHPLRTAWRTLNRTTSFWGFDYLASREIQKWRGWSTRDAVPLLALEAGSYLAVLALALLGLLSIGGACKPSWRLWLVALMIAYEMPYAIAFSGGTYHFPIMPLAIPFAAATVAHVAEAWTLTRKSHGAVVALCILAIVQLQYAYVVASMSD